MLFVATREIPTSIAPLVGIEVANDHHDPLASILVLGAAIHFAGRVIGIDEVDDVAADLMMRAIEGAHLRIDPALERFATLAVTTAIDIFDEEIDPGVQIA